MIVGAVQCDPFCWRNVCTYSKLILSLTAISMYNWLFPKLLMGSRELWFDKLFTVWSILFRETVHQLVANVSENRGSQPWEWIQSLLMLNFKCNNLPNTTQYVIITHLVNDCTQPQMNWPHYIMSHTIHHCIRTQHVVNLKSIRSYTSIISVTHSPWYTSYFNECFYNLLNNSNPSFH